MQSYTPVKLAPISKEILEKNTQFQKIIEQ